MGTELVVLDDDIAYDTINDIDQDLSISLNAITGIQSGDTMQLHVRVGTHEFTALVDSGSTHNFFSAIAVQTTGMTLSPRQNLTVVVANGERLSCSCICLGLLLHMDNEAFCINGYTITLDGFDVVLSIQWLRTLGPILLDLNLLTMYFLHDDHRVTWQGVPAPHYTCAPVCVG